MSEERNFRSSYYDKCGFRAVEEKKSIEILLKEQPVDVEKLAQFCLRFPMATKYRLYVWKIILGILPGDQETHSYVSAQHALMYKDGIRGLKILRRIDDSTPIDEVLLKLHLLEEASLPFEDKNLHTDADCQAFLAMSNAVCNVIDVDADRYLITSRFKKHFAKFREHIIAMPEKTVQCLIKEDMDRRLLQHLADNNVLNSLPLIDWFRRCFAGILPDTSVERVWDKVLGGSCSILVFIAVAIFLTFKRPLLSMTTTEEMLAYLRKIPEDCGDKLVSDATEMWQKYGCHLQPSEYPALDRMASLTK